MLEFFFNSHSTEEWLFTDSAQKNSQQQNNSPEQRQNHRGNRQPSHGDFPQIYDPQLRSPPQISPQQNIPQNNIQNNIHPQNNDLIQLNDDALYFEDLFSPNTPTSTFNQQPQNFQQNSPRKQLTTFMTSRPPPNQPLVTSQSPLKIKSPEFCPDPDEFLQVKQHLNKIPPNGNNKLYTPPPLQHRPHDIFAHDDYDFLDNHHHQLHGNQQKAVAMEHNYSVTSQSKATHHQMSPVTSQPLSPLQQSGRKLSPMTVMTSQSSLTSHQAVSPLPTQCRKRSRNSQEMTSSPSTSHCDVSKLIRVSAGTPPPQNPPFIFPEIPETRRNPSKDSFNSSDVMEIGDSPQSPTSPKPSTSQSGGIPGKLRRRNNEACRESRKKKKCERVEREKRVVNLTAENEELRREVLRMERERDLVKNQLMETIKRGFCS